MLVESDGAAETDCGGGFYEVVGGGVGTVGE